MKVTWEIKEEKLGHAEVALKRPFSEPPRILQL